MEYTVVIEETPSGWFVAQCEQMPEALTQGKTVEEAIENLKDAINLLLEDKMEDFRKSHVNEKLIRRAVAI